MTNNNLVEQLTDFESYKQNAKNVKKSRFEKTALYITAGIIFLSCITYFSGIFNKHKNVEKFLDKLSAQDTIVREHFYNVFKYCQDNKLITEELYYC